MSYNIAPDKHLRLISQSVIFVDTYTVGSRLLKINIEPDYFYSQQKVTLATGLKGTILFSVTDNQTYIYTDTPITTTITTGFVTTVNVPFKVHEDEDVITTYDLKHIESSDIITYEGIKFKGKDGLFKSEWIQKINEIKSLQVISAISYNLNNTSQGLLGYVKFDGKHKFGFRNDNLDVLFEIDANDSEQTFTVRKLNYVNINGDLTFSFNIGKINNEKYIGIFVVNTNKTNYSDGIVYSRQEIKSTTDISNTGNGFVVDYQINNITFTDTIFAINSNGVDLYINQPTELIVNTTLTQLTEGKYFCNSSSVITEMLPTLPQLESGVSILSFVCTVHKVKSTNEKLLEIVCVVNNTILPLHNIIKAFKFVNGTSDFNWVMEGDISADKIITNDDRMFVSKEEKELWNTDSSWLQPVSNIAALPVSDIVNGSSCFVISEGTIYNYSSGQWIPNNQLATANNNGLLSKELYTDITTNTALTKKVKSTVFNNRESTLNNTHIQRYVGTNVIDLTKRTTLTQDVFSNVLNLTVVDNSIVQTEANNYGVFGQHSIALGSNVRGIGNDLVIIGTNINAQTFHNVSILGTNLVIGGSYYTAIGQYNEGLVDNQFEIGGGTNTTRKNIFAINRDTGYTIATGYSVPNATSEHVLMGDGSIKQIGELGQIFGKYITTEDSIIYTYFAVKDMLHDSDLADISFGVNSVLLSTTNKISSTERSGDYSFSANNSLAKGYYSTALGNDNIINSYGGLVAGYFNKPINDFVEQTPNIESPLLILGNGTSDTMRSNAFVVKGNGNVEQQGNTILGKGKGFVMETANGSHKALVTLVLDGSNLRLNIQEI